jgi:hypothetical protein
MNFDPNLLTHGEMCLAKLSQQEGFNFLGYASDLLIYEKSWHTFLILVLFFQALFSLFAATVIKLIYCCLQRMKPYL